MNSTLDRQAVGLEGLACSNMLTKSHGSDEGITLLVDGLELRTGGALVGGLHAVQEMGKFTINGTQTGAAFVPS